MEIEYDIFISFKNSDEEGNPTKDKELAHKLYAFLQSKNLQVFFSDATLQELGTDSWSKEIQRALKVSKIFIALGSKEEYFYSYWLQRERTTFLTRKEDDKSKALYSYIAPPMTTAKLPKDIEDFECFEDTKPNEFDRLYSFISNHLARYFQRIKDDEFLDKDLANPYKGLFHFTYEDRDNYFGREKESQDIAQIVKESKFFTLLGASGSGKSSLLFAGILPLIKEKSVDILDFRPQDRPFRNLANIFIKALYPDKLIQAEKKEELTNKLLDGTIKLDNLTELYFENQKIEKLYIIIDQFEELFTLTKNSEIKNLFLDQLLQLVESNLNVTLIISLRADFLSFASYYEPFNQTINQNPKTILGLMSEENLKRAIELPAKNLGVRFEKGLIERILEEISKEAGQLPLLEFALEQFWQKMSSRVITHKSLDEMGSISHAISYHADRVYEKYPNKEAVRRIFLKLVNSGSGTEDTRRVAKFEDFDKSDRDTITLLATDRLVITTENSVEVVHEALIREWSVLKAWIEENREFLEWEKRTRIDLEFYKDNGEREEDLLRDGKLLRAKEFLESYEREVSGEFRGFIERSVEVQKRRERRKRAVLGGVFVSLLIVIGVIGYFWFEAEEAKKDSERKTYALSAFTSKIISTLIKSDDKILKKYLTVILDSNEREIFIEMLKPLLKKSDTIDEEEKVYWYKTLPSMTNEQAMRLVKILIKQSKTKYINKNSFEILKQCVINQKDLNETYCLYLCKKNDIPYSKFYSDIGLYYIVYEKYNKSDKAFKKSIELDSNNKMAYLGRIKLYKEMKEYNKEIEAIKMYSIKFNQFSSLEGKAYEYLKQGLFQEALKICEFSINNNVKSYLIYKIMGISYLNIKEYNKSISYFNKALEEENDKGSYYGLANAYSQLNKFDEAIKVYMQVLKINPKEDEAYVNLFELELTQNQPFDQLLDAKYRELFQNQKETFIHYEMLKIFQDIANGKDSEIESWKQKYVDVSLGGWNFDILHEWIDGFEDGEIKTRLVEALGVFEGHHNNK